MRDRERERESERERKKDCETETWEGRKEGRERERDLLASRLRPRWGGKTLVRWIDMIRGQDGVAKPL